MREFIAHGVVAAPLVTKRMAGDTPDAFIYLEFSDNLSFDPCIVPSSGIIQVEASENGDVWGSVVNGGSVDVSSADYPRLSAKGDVAFVRATPTDPIVGTTYWRVRVVRY
jgi:hypothetical protein